ncbi:hypothetical protein PG996_000296 [Apiospora saccharicola]|uniref:Uncharacterized protein n=1 Tax=Apiospora saccharicola TaxID=335842 RepID=A0ABR1WGB5_9PEZI
MSSDYQKDVLSMLEDTLDMMTSDYHNCITKRDMPAASLTIRREIRDIVSKVDVEFRSKMMSTPPEENNSMAGARFLHGSRKRRPGR